MKKSVEILGLPVISITEGRELGMSKTLLIDARNGKIAAVTIEDEDWYRGVKLIPYESVIAIGDDAVTVTNSENILKLDEAGDYENLLDENIRIIDTKAITKTGNDPGQDFRALHRRRRQDREVRDHGSRWHDHRDHGRSDFHLRQAGHSH